MDGLNNINSLSQPVTFIHQSELFDHSRHLYEFGTKWNLISKHIYWKIFTVIWDFSSPRAIGVSFWGKMELFNKYNCKIFHFRQSEIYMYIYTRIFQGQNEISLLSISFWLNVIKDCHEHITSLYFYNKGLIWHGLAI